MAIVISTLKNWAKKILPEETYQEIRWWLGITQRPPEHIAWRMMKSYAKKFGIRVFVETGTFRGDTTWALKNTFDEIHSIELSVPIFKKAKERFAAHKHIHLYQGDSGEMLPVVLNLLNEPAMFYLDGHWCGSDTAKADINTPIVAELEHVLNHKIKNHLILIDDARLFGEEEDYPTIVEIESFVKKLNPALHVEVCNDRIVIHT